MDYKTDYIKFNPDYHKADASRKLSDITSTYKGRSESILDLGCGAGSLTSLLLFYYRPHYIEGVDISRRAIDIAKSQDKQIKWTVADVTEYQPKEKFDLVVSADLLEHIRGDKDFLKRISSFGKRIVIRVPLEKTTINELIKKTGLGDEFNRSEERFGHINHYSLLSLESLFKSAGFQIEKFELFPLAKRSLFRFELLRWFSLLVWPFSKQLSSKIFGGFAVFVLRPKRK